MGLLINCRRGEVGWWCLPCTCPISHSPTLSTTLYPPNSILQVTGCTGDRPCLSAPSCGWGMRRSFRDWVEFITFGVTEDVSPSNANLLVKYSTAPVNSQIYFYVLFEWLRIYLYFQIEQLQSLSLAMQPSCFRVAKISFYIQPLTFCLCSLQTAVSR